MTQKVQIEPYEGPAGGWGSAKSLLEIVTREGIGVGGSALMAKQNKPDGFACVSCAWAKPAEPNPFEFCENGAKATAWEITSHRADAAFFAAHTVTELRGWSDYRLEEQGRLTEPLRYDRASDRYVPVAWEEAFAAIGRELKALEHPDQAVFYASGRASLETSYLWQLLARLYGTNNLPDSSNMCHESTSVGLKASIGAPVGTVTLADFDTTDCLFFFGQNTGSNSPRMLNQLQAASKRGAAIVTFNPLKERGLERFKSPQHVDEMLSPRSTPISAQYHQVKTGGDTAAMLGMAKVLLDLEAEGVPGAVDRAFIAEHTQGFAAFEAQVRAQDWAALEARSGLTRAAIEAAARVYAAAKATIGVYGMGITQHRAGVETVQVLVNLLLMRGNIGRPGAGVCPVRGHSNVQGQRTMGITEKPELAPLDKLKTLYGFEPPTKLGLNTVEACEGIIDGTVKAFVALGGNFLRAVPETGKMEEAWPKLRLSVQIATKLNRTHLLPGAVTYLLPCLGRIERDAQAGGEQSVSVEDSTACIHGSRGRWNPASPQLKSEPAIVAGIAKAALAPNPKVDWDGWVADYATIRTAIGATFPDFEGMETRMWQPGGFRRTVPSSQRDWKTDSGKATFVVPKSLEEDPDMPRSGADVLDLITLRSNDQFNTTIYGYNDRFRGVNGTRMVLFMNKADVTRLGLSDGQTVSLETDATDGVERRVEGFRVTPYDIPAGNVGGYYPECNPLIPLWHHAEKSKVPAAKSIPVRVVA